MEAEAISEQCERIYTKLESQMYREHREFFSNWKPDRNFHESLRLFPGWTETEIRRLEERYGITFPQTYRIFLSEIGLWNTLLKTPKKWGLAACYADPKVALRESCLLRAGLGANWLEELYGRNWERDYSTIPLYAGTLTLYYHGDGNFSVLALNGPYKDRVFRVNRDNSPPVLDDAPYFLDWYEKHLDSGEKPVMIQKLIKRKRIVRKKS